jgi:hypothetical protein
MSSTPIANNSCKRALSKADPIPSLSKKPHEVQSFTPAVGLRASIAKMVPTNVNNDTLPTRLAKSRENFRVHLARLASSSIPRVPIKTPGMIHKDDWSNVCRKFPPILTLFQLLSGQQPEDAGHVKIQKPLADIVRFTPWYDVSILNDDKTVVKEVWTSTVMARCDTACTEARAAGLFDATRPFAAFFPVSNEFGDKLLRFLTLGGSTAEAGARLFVQQRLETNTAGLVCHRSLPAIIALEGVLEIAMMRITSAVCSSKRSKAFHTAALQCGKGMRRPEMLEWCATEVEAVRGAIHAREYLLDLATRLSCLIAIHSAMDSERTTWRWLLRKHLKEDKIDGLASTWVATIFNNHCHRAGVWFDFWHADPTEFKMFMIAIYVSFGVPIWIRWPQRIDKSRFERYTWMEASLPGMTMALDKDRPFLLPTRSKFFRPYLWYRETLADYCNDRGVVISYRILTAPPSERRAIETRIRQVICGEYVKDAHVVVWEKTGRDWWITHDIHKDYRNDRFLSYHTAQLRYCPVTNCYEVAPAWRPVPGSDILIMPRALSADPADDALRHKWANITYSTSVPQRPVLQNNCYHWQKLEHQWLGARMLFPLQPVSNERFCQLLLQDHLRAAPSVEVETLKARDGGYSKAISYLLPGEEKDMDALFNIRGKLLFPY